MWFTGASQAVATFQPAAISAQLGAGDGGSFGEVTAAFDVLCVSHSCELATRESGKPRSRSTSVRPGSKEATRGVGRFVT